MNTPMHPVPLEHGHYASEPLADLIRQMLAAPPPGGNSAPKPVEAPPRRQAAPVALPPLVVIPPARECYVRTAVPLAAGAVLMYLLLLLV